MVKRILPVVAASLELAGGNATAADNLGVTVYAGAKYDEQWSQMQAQVMQAMGEGGSACYRTMDPVAKVAQFYQKDGFRLSVGAVTEDGTLLLKGANLSMTIENMKSLDNTNGSGFCIWKK